MNNNPIIINTVKAVLFILLVIGFFAGYNHFLINKNMQALQSAVSDIALAETVGPATYLGPLLQLEFSKEISLTDINERDLFSTQFSNYVVSNQDNTRENVDVVAMSKDMLSKQQQERNFLLRAIDYILYKAHSLFKSLLNIFKGVSTEDIDYLKIDKIKSLENSGNFKEAIKECKDILKESSDSKESSLVMLKMGFVNHKNGEFDKAYGVYKELIRKYPFSREVQIARILIKKVEDKRRNQKSLKAYFKKAENTLDKSEKQKILYSAALKQIASFDIKGVINTLEKAKEIISDTPTYNQIQLRLGWCVDLLGDSNKAADIFKSIISSNAKGSIKSKARYQLVLIYANQDKKDQTKKMIDETLSFIKDQNVRSVVLFSVANIFTFDSKDKGFSSFYLSKFLEELPADSLAAQTAEIADNYADVDVLANVSTQASSFMGGSLLAEKLLPKKALDAIKRAAVRFTTFITEGVTEIVVLEEYDVAKGDFTTIDLTQKRLNKYIKKWFPVGNKARVWDVSSEFTGKRKLTMHGSIHLPGNLKIDGFIDGKFEIVKQRDKPYWLHDLKNRNFTIFLVDRCKIAGVPVPKAIMHTLLRPSVIQFNKDFPLEVELFVLDEKQIVFAGPIREDLKEELLAEAYGLRHLSQRDEESGFIYGRRKESLSDKQSGIQTGSTATRDRNIGGLSADTGAGEGGGLSSTQGGF